MQAQNLHSVSLHDWCHMIDGVLGTTVTHEDVDNAGAGKFQVTI